MKILAAAAFVLASLALSAPARADPPELVDQVSQASVSLSGHTATICARGTVPTGGYSRPTLRPARRAGHNGVYDFDFTAVRPEGMATQMVSQISAAFTWTGAPADLKGVRVRGMNGAAIAMLGAGGGCGG